MAKLSIALPFKLCLTGMTDREKYLRADWFWSKEPETLAWIESFEQNTIFWDIGANIGCYSLYAASINRVAMTYAFEPFAPNFQALKANIEANAWWHVIKPEHMALSDECGMSNFESKSHEIGSSGGQIGETRHFVLQNAYPVEVTTGDSYANLFGCPNYVKIDVDGQESRVLAGMKQVLACKTLKSILVEDNTADGSINSLILGYGFQPAAEFELLKLRKSAFNRIYRRA